LRCRWEVFRQHPFPAERSDAVVEGVCLVSLDSAAAGCIESLVDGGVLGPRELAVLMKCQQELAAAMPKLDAQARPYFEELAWLVREAQRSGAAAMDSAWRAEQQLKLAREPIVWSGDLNDDCTARWAGLTLRAEEMDEGSWWWAVYDDDIDNPVRASYDDDMGQAKSGQDARNAAEREARTYLRLDETGGQKRGR
jgi:hypothetical protein